MRAPFFERMDIFLQHTMGMRATFLENGLFFLTKYERESSDFFIEKHGKRAC